MQMSSMMVEHVHSPSRQQLLDLWTLLDWLQKNRKAMVKVAAEETGVDPAIFHEAIRALGHEVELWHPNPPRRFKQQEEDGALDEAF